MKSICVFCGSGLGTNPQFKKAAVELGKLMAERNIELIYGGAKIGLMGALADAVMQNSGVVTGVIPHFLAGHEIAHDGITALHKVQSMHERKTRMAELSEGFVALPGGYGTLEEIFEIITWAQLKLHAYPVAIINTDDYYKHLLAQLDHMVENGLLKAIYRDMLIVADTPEKALNLLESKFIENQRGKLKLEDT